jgi:ABC-type phosphate transport system ATPase subunit
LLHLLRSPIGQVFGRRGSFAKSIAESIVKLLKKDSAAKITIQGSDGTNIETISASELKDPKFADKLIERLKEKNVTK